MSGVAHGIDIVAVDRLREACERNRAFLATVFTAGEREYCLTRADPYVHLACRFAAKEACMKALGLGLLEPTTGHALGDIEVERGPGGQPGLALSGWVGSLARRRGIRRSSVSISHAAGLALAAVVLVTDAPGEG
jgi:holo-[acyl-carrier protein] synthase